MRIILNSYLTLIKSGWVILLLSSLPFSCQKEISEKEKVEQFVNTFVSYFINESVHGEKLENFFAKDSGLFPGGSKHLLVIESYKIQEINLEKCQDLLYLTKVTHDCYEINVIYKDKYYVDYDGKLRENVSLFSDDYRETGTYNNNLFDTFTVVKENNEFKVEHSGKLQFVVTEKGLEKFVTYRQRIFGINSK